MAVHVKYKGRCGNKIFQYVSARIFAEKNKLNLVTQLDCDLVKTTPHKIFDELNIQDSLTTNSNSFKNDEIECFGNHYNYIFDDFFQNCVFINKNQDLVKSFFDLPQIEKNTEDIVLHLRLDDMIHGTDITNPTDWGDSEIPHPNYYKRVLNSENYKKVYIVVDKIKYEWEENYLKHFNDFNPVIISQSPHEDFIFMRNFNKIITSISTFSYWSAFLSDAEKIYTLKNSGLVGINLRSHGPHVKELWNIKNKSITIDEKFYFGE
jgi:hypothetical protein